MTVTAQREDADLYLADISVPDRVYQRLGLEVGRIFAQSDLIAI